LNSVPTFFVLFSLFPVPLVCCFFFFRLHRPNFPYSSLGFRNQTNLVIKSCHLSPFVEVTLPLSFSHRAVFAHLCELARMWCEVRGGLFVASFLFFTKSPLPVLQFCLSFFISFLMYPVIWLPFPFQPILYLLIQFLFFVRRSGGFGLALRRCGFPPSSVFLPVPTWVVLGGVGLSGGVVVFFTRTSPFSLSVWASVFGDVCGGDITHLPPSDFRPFATVPKRGGGLRGLTPSPSFPLSLRFGVITFFF